MPSKDIISYEEIVIETGKKMARDSLTVSTWGNISVRDPESGNIYLTPSGMDYETSTAEDIVVFNADGKIIKGRRKPSTEKDVHIFIYQRAPGVNAIIHTHAVYSTILAVAGIPLPVITEEMAQTIGGEVICSEYALPGTPLLGENVAKVVEAGHRAVLLPSHGALCTGGNMRAAYKICGVLEKAARIYISVKSMGLEPCILPPDDVSHMFGFFSNNYGQTKNNMNNGDK
jgi:L-fuculose-phosphate aldolase